MRYTVETWVSPSDSASSSAVNARCLAATASRMAARVLPTVWPSSRRRGCDRRRIDEVAGVSTADGCHACRASDENQAQTSSTPAPVFGGRLDRTHVGIDVAQVGVEQIEIEVEVGQEVDLVDDHDVGRAEHDRVLEGLLFAFGDREDHCPGVLADIELGRADQVADVLDHDEVEVGERQPGERGADHRGVEVAFAAEAVGGVDQRDGRAEAGEAIGIDRGLDIALHDPDSQRGAELQQHLTEQRRLACTRRRHQVDHLHVGVVEIVAVGLGGAVVLAKDLLQHLDS